MAEMMMGKRTGAMTAYLNIKGINGNKIVLAVNGETDGRKGPFCSFVPRSDSLKPLESTK